MIENFEFSPNFSAFWQLLFFGAHATNWIQIQLVTWGVTNGDMLLFATIRMYSKALRCMFFGERKNSCSSKVVQLLLLIRVKARWSKNCAAQGFHYINSFISNFFGPNSKTCTCEVRAAWGHVSRGLTVLTLFHLTTF